MLSLPQLQVHRPTTVREAVALAAATPGALYIAGGTDLLPNLKQGLYDSRVLISVCGLGLSSAQRLDDGSWRLGAGLTLQALASHVQLRRDYVGLSDAAAHIAGPQHRARGTLGGNVMLDTRCLYYNQTQEWRESLGYCLKRTGDWCHVVGSKATCVAAHSSDTVPMLVALGANLCFATSEGSIEVSLRDLFGKDGRPERHKTVPAEALLTHVVVPAQAQGLRTSFHKLRQRDSIDFAQLNLGVAVRMDGDLVQAIEVVFSGLLPRPKPLRKLQIAHGRPLDDALITELEDLAYKQVRPQPSRDGDVAYRRKMARVLLRRALRDVRA